MNDDFTFKINILGYWGAFANPGGATYGILVTTKEGTFLLDCGGGVLSRFFEHANLTDQFQGVILSHLHFDHVGDLGSLYYAINYALRIGKRTKQPHIYGPATPEPMWSVLQYPRCDMHVLNDGISFQIAGANITAKALHHPVECYAFRIEKGGKSFVYYTDTSYDAHHVDFLRDTDLLICEATMTEGSLHTTGLGHISDIEAGHMAADSHAKTLCLFHLPSDADLAVMRARAATVYHGEIYTPDICSQFIL